MKKLYSVLLFLLIGQFAFSQSFNFELTGNPVNTTGWTYGPQSYIEADQFVLTNSIGDQAGYIYYSTPQNLTNCAQFTVSFDFRITNSSIPTADGIAFWYITNPPTGFVAGGGIGLPNNPNGLLLILDTYNNAPPNANPKVSLRRLTGTSNYDEGTTTGQLVPDLLSQTFITDGNWHTCVLTYYFGTVTVAFDGNPPAMTGTTTLGLNGYFGFSAGTGASWAKHAIKNVSVTGAPEPDQPAGVDISYCQGDVAVPLTTTTGSNLSWFTVPTGGVALPGAPTPSTAIPGTYEWYVSQAVPGCNVESVRDTVVVTIHPKPSMPVISVPPYCSGQPAAPITVVSGSNVQWYEEATGGTGSNIIPGVPTDSAAVYTWYATQTNEFGCESDRIAVTAVVRQTPIPDYSFDIGYACNRDTVRFVNETEFGTSYTWNFDNGYTDTALNPTMIYNNQGTYYVSLVAQNQYCTDSVIKPVIIDRPLQADFTASDDTVCVGTIVNFQNTSTATSMDGVNPSYYWDFNDGTTTTVQHPNKQFNQPGIYKVMLVAKNFVPCSDTTYRNIYVDSLPYLSFHRSDTAICTGDQITFEGSYLNNGLEQIQWNFGDSPDIIRQQNPVSHSYLSPGVFTVSITAGYRACGELTQSFEVTVKPLPVLHLGPDTSICPNGDVLILGDQHNAGNAQASWLWSTGETTSSIGVRQTGTYSARVTVDQCSAGDEVVVTKNCRIDIPNSFTPNGDGTNDYFFPRNILSQGLGAFSMSIFNRWGQLIFETNNIDGRGWDGRFNGKDQPTGVYIYRIKAVLLNGSIEDYTGNVTLMR
jgi:gliding motility-associated-like protein